jgi:hypothetical protein
MLRWWMDGFPGGICSSTGVKASFGSELAGSEDTEAPKPFLRPRKVALVPPEGSNLTTHASK